MLNAAAAAGKAHRYFSAPLLCTIDNAANNAPHRNNREKNLKILWSFQIPSESEMVIKETIPHCANIFRCGGITPSRRPPGKAGFKRHHAQWRSPGWANRVPYLKSRRREWITSQYARYQRNRHDQSATEQNQFFNNIPTTIRWRQRLFSSL
jgi:hypothetical protein